MVTHRLSRFSYIISFFFFFFLLANSMCWPITFFLLANSTCWPITLQPDGSHRLSLLAFPHAREILLEVLAINRHGKLDTIQLFKHVGISRQNLINHVRSVPSWRPLAIFSIFSSQTKSPTWKFFGLTFLLYARATLALFSFIFSNDQSLSSIKSSTLSFIKAAYCSVVRSFWNSTRLDPVVISHGSTASWP